MKRKQRKHTCVDCGNTFFSAHKRPSAPNAMQVAGAKMQATGSAMSVFSGGASKGGYQMQAARMESKRDIRKAWDHPTCTQCGSANIATTIVKF